MLNFACTSSDVLRVSVGSAARNFHADCEVKARHLEANVTYPRLLASNHGANLAPALSSAIELPTSPQRYA